MDCGLFLPNTLYTLILQVLWKFFSAFRFPSMDNGSIHPEIIRYPDLVLGVVIDVNYIFNIV